MSTLWTDAETHWLICLVGEKNDDLEIARIMGRTVSSINHRRHRIKLSSIAEPKCHKKLWTDHDIKTLIAERDKRTPIHVICHILGRSVASINAAIDRIPKIHAAKLSRRSALTEMALIRQNHKNMDEDVLRAFIRHHRWFAVEIMKGRGGDGLPRLEGKGR